MDPDNVKALKYLLRVAPTGEMQDVLHHLNILISQGGNMSQTDMEQNSDIIAQLRKWYETHRYHIELPDERVALVTAAGNAGTAENGDFQYYDNILKVMFSFNPFTLKSEIVSDSPLEQPTSDIH